MFICCTDPIHWCDERSIRSLGCEHLFHSCPFIVLFLPFFSNLFFALHYHSLFCLALLHPITPLLRLPPPRDAIARHTPRAKYRKKVWCRPHHRRLSYGQVPSVPETGCETGDSGPKSGTGRATHSFSVPSSSYHVSLTQAWACSYFYLTYLSSLCRGGTCEAGFITALQLLLLRTSSMLIFSLL